MPGLAIHDLLRLQGERLLHRLVLVKAAGHADLPKEPSITTSFDLKTLTLSLAGNRHVPEADEGGQALSFLSLLNQGWQQIGVARGLYHQAMFWHSDRSLVLKFDSDPGNSRLSYHVMEYAKGYCQFSLLLNITDIIKSFIASGEHSVLLQFCTHVLLSIFKHVLSAVDQMHRNGIYHGNLSAEHVLIDCRGLMIWPEFADWMGSHQQDFPGSDIQKHFLYGLSHAEALLQTPIFEQNDLIRLTLLMMSIGVRVKRGQAADLSQLLPSIGLVLLKINQVLRQSTTPIKICGLSQMKSIKQSVEVATDCAEVVHDLISMQSIFLHALLKKTAVPRRVVHNGLLFLKANKKALLAVYPELEGVESYFRLAYILSTIDGHGDSVRIGHAIKTIRRLLGSEQSDSRAEHLLLEQVML